MTITRRVFLAAGTAMLAVACGQTQRSPENTSQPSTSNASPSTSNASPSSRVVNLYSARHYDTDTAVYDSFTKKTGIKVNLVEADADKLIERIKSEGTNSPADLLITVDAGRLWRSQEAGILQPVSSQVLESAVPSNLREPQGHWFGLTQRARVIVYNKDRVNPSELSTYEALADEKWKGRLMVRSSNHVYNQSLTGSVLAAVGPEKTEAWARSLVSNFARKPEGNDTAQLKAIASGVADLALVNTYYVVRLAKSKKEEDRAIASKLGVFFPNQGDRGTHINISGAGVLKNAPNKEAAILFLEHLVSPEAQEIFAKSNNEYPVREGVAIDSVLAGYGTFKADQLNASLYGRNNAEALKIMDRAGWS